MSDYGQFQAFIYEVPEANVEAVLDLLMERGLGTGWDEGIVYEKDESGEFKFDDEKRMVYHRASDEEMREILRGALTGDDQITDQQARLDIVDDLGGSLAKLDVVFEMHQDPAYEYMGVGARNHPRIGLVQYDADADGVEYVATFRLRDIIQANPIPKAGEDVNGAISAVATILSLIGDAANLAHAAEFDRLVKHKIEAGG